MAEQTPARATAMRTFNKEREKIAERAAPSSDVEPTLPIPTGPIEADITYPEGGRAAWLVVLGAWCSLTASYGLYNTVGVFEASISRDILPDVSKSNVGWIFGIYAFVTYFCGVQIGPTFDAKGPRELLIAGSICTLVAIFALSTCTEYYQFVLALSVLGGLGSSLLVTPAMGSVSHWFYERRGLAGGVAFVGGGFGGVLFPLMMQSLLPQIGWGWSIRALGLILLLLCGTSVAFCRTRVPPRHGAHTTWRDTLPDPRIFLDGTGAMSVTTAAIVLTDLAYLLPVTYLPSYYMERQNINRDETLTGKAAFAYQLLAIFNAASCVGRCVVGDLGDRFGRYNSMIVSMFLSLLSLLCFFLVDVLVAGLRNVAFLVVFVVLFGFVSGTSISLTPICLGQLCETRDFGRYYASCYTVVAFGCLTSVPIAGRLLDAIEVDGKERYRGVVTFTASSYLLALLCFIWVRVRIQGWDWRTKW